MSAYKKVSQYNFEVGGVALAIVDWTIDLKPAWDSNHHPWIAIEERDKNGQEDTHMYGELVWADDDLGMWGWKWHECRSMFVDYGYDAFPDDIIEFLTANPLPESMLS